MRMWCFDFDGTLSTIVPDRTAAQLHPDCAVMLRHLTEMPFEQVVIISSRSLDDIAGRITIPDVIIGGCSGTKWLLPDGCRLTINDEQEAALERTRRELLPDLLEIATRAGIDSEDKKWSVAFHFGAASENVRNEVRTNLTAICGERGLTMYNGHNVWDIQLVPNFNKSAGLGFLASFMKINVKDKLIYAGDDENDAVAMRWTMERGGIAIMVREKLSIPGAKYVSGPSELAGLVNEMCLYP